MKRGRVDRAPFKQVSIIGLGLIGGSLGMALRRGKVARRVIGFARHESTLRRAKRLGAIDDGCTELCPEWLDQSDLIVLATPPSAVPAVAKAVARLTRGSLFLTDVASAKKEIVRTLERTLPSRIRFVGAHPMAGSEQSGIEAAKPGLFKGAACVVTRTGRTDRRALARVSALWRHLGARVVVLTPERHDALVAQVSHVPHLAAAALARLPEEGALALAGGGFLDTTRVALSDPELWQEICWINRVDIGKGLDRLIAELARLRRSLGSTGAGLILRAAQRRRRKIQR